MNKIGNMSSSIKGENLGRNTLKSFTIEQQMLSRNEYILDKYLPPENILSGSTSKEAIRDKMTLIIGRLMKDKYGRDKILDKVEELKKKRAVINYINSQFGYSNPLSLSHKLTCISDLNALHINQELLKGKSMVRKNIKDLKSGQIFTRRTLPTDLRVQMAQESKRDIDEHDNERIL